MNDTDTILILMVIALLWCAGWFGLIVHDERILQPARTEAQMQYFIESDNLTNQGKYDTALSICNETFSNISLYEKIWATKIIPGWGIEWHKEHEINRCKCKLLEID